MSASREAAGFMTLNNEGTEPDRLVAARSPLAEIEIHGIRVVGGELRMQLYTQGLKVPVGMPIELKPRGYHLYMRALKAPLVRGAKIPVTLCFEKAGSQQVELTVEAEGPIGKEMLHA